jgi:hypothetical protein
MMRCQYEPLDPAKRQIRLLEILPRNHKLGKLRPVCRLFPANLDDKPSFTALSYVWGDQKNKRVVLVNKHPWKVTQNLFLAMMELRESKSITVWIDAICINQEDDDEKTWQVGLMRSIYQQASNVIAWLGPSEKKYDSDTVMDYLNTLGKKAEVCGFHHGSEPYVPIWRAMISAQYMENPHEVMLRTELDGRVLPVSKYALKSLLHSISGCRSQDGLLPLAGLKYLFRRPWWGRVWVLQEITVPRHVHFACGTKRIPCRRFRAAYNAYYVLWSTLGMMRSEGQHLNFYQKSLTVYMVSHRVNIMLSMPDVYQNGGFVLVALFRATCVQGVRHLAQEGAQHLEATDPRDKVFALLGISEDQRELKALGLSPDYTKSKEEVYVITMAALLRQGHISILSLCRTTSVPRSLPSWVVDWSMPIPIGLQDVKPDHLTLYPGFNASGRRSHNHVTLKREDSGPQKISIFACIYDKVLQVGNVPRSSIQWLYEFLRLTYEAKDIYTNFKERLEAVTRTSHVGCGWNADTHGLSKVNRFCDALPIFKEEILQIKNKRIQRHLRKFLNSRDGRNLLQGGRGKPSKIFNDFMRMSSGRSPFVTEHGHLGVSSSEVRQGDIVALIAGAQVPFVLRPCRNGEYSIVSEAYVDGIMEGEAAEDGTWEYIELI